MKTLVAELRRAAAAGVAAIRRYPLLALVTYAAQLLISLTPAAVLAALLLVRLGDAPMFDRAMDGDLAAIATIIRSQPMLLATAGLLMIAAALAYVSVSWFITAGLIHVYREQPESRAETARSFGAGGARRFFAFARLFGWSLVPSAVGLALLGYGLVSVGDSFLTILDFGALSRTVILALAPGAVALWIVWTAIDYARIELCARQVSSWRALLRGFRRVLGRPICLLHTLLGFLAGAALVWIYAQIAGAGLVSSWLAVFVVRQLVFSTRHLIRLLIIGGQVAIAADLDTRDPTRESRIRSWIAGIMSRRSRDEEE